MDKLQWFKFRPSDWIMGRISKTNKTTQSEFINFCCTYWNKECEVKVSQCQFEFTPQVFKRLVGLEIIKIDGDYVRINFLDEQMEGIKDIRKKASLAGKASAKKRNQIKNRSTGVQRNSTDKSRVDKKENIYRSFDHLSISIDQVEKLKKDYSLEIINHTLDSIENYKGNKNYKSLYLTCKSWMRRDYGKNNKNDSFFDNVMKQIKQ